MIQRFRSVRDVHFPKPGLLCLENALSDGTVQPLESMQALKLMGDKLGLPIHLDGARLFNAAAYLGIEAKHITRHVDSLMVCLSKGLGAPSGSLLCGPRDFIEHALYKRKIMGCGMRQIGVLAAAGLVALRGELPRIAADHEMAAYIASAFSDHPEVFEVLTPQPSINMVFLRLRKGGPENERRFQQQLADIGIQSYPAENGVFRFVCHRDVVFAELRAAMEKLSRLARCMNEW